MKKSSILNLTASALIFSLLLVNVSSASPANGKIGQDAIIKQKISDLDTAINNIEDQEMNQAKIEYQGKTDKEREVIINSHKKTITEKSNEILLDYGFKAVKFYQLLLILISQMSLVMMLQQDCIDSRGIGILLTINGMIGWTWKTSQQQG
jgi:hypothetical protein